MRSTMKDIADKTGLSLGTISKFINGVQVKEENAKLIQQAIEDLDYYVNSAGRQLKTQKSNVIAFIVPSLQLAFSTKIIATVERELASNGYSILLCVLDDDERRSENKLNNILYQNVDGMIIMPSKNELFLKNWLDKTNMNKPIIVIDRLLETRKEFTHVLVNNATAVQDGMDYFIKEGHEKIAIILGDENGYTTIERKKGYEQALMEQTIAINSSYVKYGNYNKDDGYKCFKELWEHDDRPSAIFVTNHDMMLGCLEYVATNNLIIGEDISLLGFDILELSPLFYPSLAMIVQPIEKMSEYIANQLIAQMINGKVTNKLKVFECEFIHGQSIKKMRSGLK